MFSTFCVAGFVSSVHDTFWFMRGRIQGVSRIDGQCGRLLYCIPGYLTNCTDYQGANKQSCNSLANCRLHGESVVTTFWPQTICRHGFLGCCVAKWLEMNRPSLDPVQLPRGSTKGDRLVEIRQMSTGSIAVDVRALDVKEIK